MRARRFVAVGAVVWAALVSLTIAFAPVYTTGSSDYSLSEIHTDTAPRQTTTRSTGIDVHGPDVLVALSLPILLTCIPLFAAKRFARSMTITGAVLLVAFCVLGAMSVGLYYLPSAAGLVYLAVASIINSGAGGASSTPAHRPNT